MDRIKAITKKSYFLLLIAMFVSAMIFTPTVAEETGDEIILDTNVDITNEINSDDSETNDLEYVSDDSYIENEDITDNDILTDSEDINIDGIEEVVIEEETVADDFNTNEPNDDLIEEFESELVDTQKTDALYAENGENSGEAYAVLQDDGQLIFFRSTNTYEHKSKGTAIDIYGNEYTGTIYAGIETKTDVSAVLPRFDMNSVKVAEGQIVRPLTCDSMFYHCEELENCDLTGFITDDVKSMADMFNGCPNLRTITFGNFSTDSVEDMSSMFKGCSSLDIPREDIEGWNVENVKTMSYMFFGSGISSIDVTRWSTKNVENMAHMFGDCKNLQLFETNNKKWFSRWTTENVNDMWFMFNGCSSLQSIDVSNWNVSNVKDIGRMFSCTAIKSIDLSTWDTPKLENITGLLLECKSLKNVDISGLTLTNVQTFSSIFKDCESLETVNLQMLNVENVNSISSLFDGCKNLKQVGVAKWNTSNIKYFDRIFKDCVSLENISLDGWQFSNAEYMREMFSGCSSLRKIDFSNCDNSKMKMATDIFKDCKKLSEITIGSSFRFAGNGITTTSYKVLFPTPSVASATGMWIKKDGSAGPISAQELRNQYDANAASWAGTWIWEENNEVDITLITDTVYAKTRPSEAIEVTYTIKDSSNNIIKTIKSSGGNHTISSLNKDEEYTIEGNGNSSDGTYVFCTPLKFKISELPEKSIGVLLLSDYKPLIIITYQKFFSTYDNEYVNMKFTLYDSQRTIVKEWETSGGSTTVNNLTYGETYTITGTPTKAYGLYPSVDEDMASFVAGKTEGNEFVVPYSAYDAVFIVEKHDATCEEPGYEIRGYDDKNGGVVLLPKIETDKPVGHMWGEVTYEWSSDHTSVTASRKCTRENCSKEEKETVGLESSKITKQPSCTEKGITTYKSKTFANNAFTAQEISVANIETVAHKWGEWKTVKQPTYEEEGVSQRKCENCEAKEEKPIEKLVKNEELGSEEPGNKESENKETEKPGTGSSGNTPSQEQNNGDNKTYTEPTKTIEKAENPLSVKGKTVKVKQKKVQKKAYKLSTKKTIKFTKQAKGTITYKITSVKKGKKNFKKYFKINSKTGVITVKKGIKKGTYKVKLRLTASGDNNYNSITKNITVKVKIS